jgi:hypothetical protein
MLPRIRKKAVKENPQTDLYNYSYTSSEINFGFSKCHRVSIGLNSFNKKVLRSSKAEEHNNYMISTKHA